MKLIVTAALLTAFWTSAASAEQVRYVDQACVAEQASRCARRAGAPEVNVAVASGLQFNSQFNAFRSQQGIAEACQLMAQIQSNSCIKTVDLPTATEVQTAIRAGNDQVLAAWLAALEATSQRPASE